MRTSGLGRFLTALGVVFASAFVSSCDSPNASQTGTKGQIRVPIPSLSAHRGLAAQNSSDPLEPSKIRVRIVLARTGEVLLDRSYDENDPAVNDQTEPTTITIQFQYPAGAEAEAFTVDVSAFNTSNVELMHVGPLTFHLGADGRSANVEGSIQWVGPGRDVTSVVISPRSITVAVGATSPISCVGNPGGLTVFPFEMSSSNSAVVSVTERGNFVTGVSPGAAQVFCELFTNGTGDVIPVTVIGSGTAGITLVSGGGQTGNPGTVLPTPIKVQVRGAGGALLAGATVSFAPGAGSGSANPTSSLTAADGTTTTTWTLGTAIGTQTMVVSVPALGFSMNVTATSVAPPQTGVSGTIRNGQGAALSGMLVELRSGSNNTAGAPVFSSTTGAPGTYSFSSLTPGVFTVLVSGSGFTTQSQNVTVTNGVLASLNFTMTNAGSLTGTMVNASNQAPLSGQTVELRNGSGVTTGPTVATAQTNAQGGYTFTGLAAGAFTIRAVVSGFTEFSVTVTVANGQTTNQPISMAPTFAGIRIVLSWNNTLDLDSHLFVPASSTIYYDNLGDCAVVCLEADKIGGPGSEAVRIVSTVPGNYTFIVHNFTDETGVASTNAANPNMSASGATVQVYVNSVLTRTFTVPNQPGTLWTVFDLSGSVSSPTITARNTMSGVPAPAPAPPAAALQAGPPLRKAPVRR